MAKSGINTNGYTPPADTTAGTHGTLSGAERKKIQDLGLAAGGVNGLVTDGERQKIGYLGATTTTTVIHNSGAYGSVDNIAPLTLGAGRWMVQYQVLYLSGSGQANVQVNINTALQDTLGISSATPGNRYLPAYNVAGGTPVSLKFTEFGGNTLSIQVSVYATRIN